MKDTLNRLDVSQVMKQFDGKPFPGDATVTLQTCLGIILNGDNTDLSKDDQNEVFKAGVKVALANGEVFLKQSEYDVLKKLCDKPRPSDHPFIKQTSVCVMIRKLVDHPEIVDDFAATEPTNRIAKKSKAEADGEALASK